MAVAAFSLVRLPRELETAPEKPKQFVGGPKPKFPPRIYFFDRSLEMTVWRSRLWSELQNERVSHEASVGHDG